MKNGYSLVELVVTITLASILAAVAIPYFNQSNVDASWFTEQAKAAVRYAQRQAVAQKRTVYVNVMAAEIRLCYNPPPACSQPVQDLRTGTDFVVSVPAGIAISPVAFSFNGLGQPSAGTTFTAGSGTVTVTAETGYVP